MEDRLNPPAHRALGYRWFILFQFSIATLSNAIFSLSFSPIASIAKDYFNVDYAHINVLSASFMILYPFGTALAVLVRVRLGIRGSMVLCMGGMTCAGWLRYNACDSDSGAKAGILGYPMILIGQSLAALMQPFVTNSSSLLAATWFPSSERAMATTIATMSNVMGLGVGTVLPSILVTSSGGIPTLMLVQAIAVSIIFVIVVVCFQGAPHIPPSLSQLRRSSEPLLRSPGSAGGATESAFVEQTGESSGIEAGNQTRGQQVSVNNNQDVGFTRDGVLQNYTNEPVEFAEFNRSAWEDVKVCLRNRDFRLLLLGFSMQVGMFSALCGLVEQIVSPAGYDSQDAGTFGGVMMVAGILTAGVVGALLDRTKRYFSALKITNVVSLATFIFFTLMIRPDNRTWLIVSFALMGCAMLPGLPISLECASESMYPVSEDTTAGLLIMCGQPFGVLLTFVLGYLLSFQPVYHVGDPYVFQPVYIIGLTYTIVSVGIIMMFKGESRRQGFENAHHDYSLLDEGNNNS